MLLRNVVVVSWSPVSSLPYIYGFKTIDQFNYLNNLRLLQFLHKCIYVNPLLHYIITYVTLIRHLHLHIRNGSVTVVVTVCVVTVVVDVISAAPPYKLHHNIALLPFFMSLPSKYPLRSTSTSSILIFTTALIKVLHPLEPKLVDAVAEHHQLRGRVQGHFGSQHSLLLRPQGRHYWRRHVDTLLHALQNTAIPAKRNSGLISRL